MPLVTPYDSQIFHLEPESKYDMTKTDRHNEESPELEQLSQQLDPPRPCPSVSIALFVNSHRSHAVSLWNGYWTRVTPVSPVQAGN